MTPPPTTVLGNEAASIRDGELRRRSARFADRVALTPTVGTRRLPNHLPPLDITGRATTEIPALARLTDADPDPLTAAATVVHSALLACQDAVAEVTGRDVDLEEAFTYAGKQLDLAARMLAQTRFGDATIHQTARTVPFGPMLDDVPRLTQPTVESRERLYGLRGTLRGALTFLAESVRGLGSAPRFGVSAMTLLPPVALVAAAASRVERVADVVVADAVTQRRAATPELPGVGGDVEITAGPRAAPYRRAGLAARVRFTPGRVELTTAQGRFSVGQRGGVGALLWVAPGSVSAAGQMLDSAERWSPVPELEQLGTVHVLDRAGRSLVALEVADWAAQPTTVVDQHLVDQTRQVHPLGAVRGLLALETLGFTRGAATTGVPVLRGVAHPPPAEDSLGTLRPAPHRPRYAERESRVAKATARRRRRFSFTSRDLGPTLPWSYPFRALAPWLLALAPVVIWPGGGRGWFQVLVLILTLAVLIEPFLAWGWRLVRDWGPRPRALARYRARRTPWSPRVELRGGDLVLTARSGHRFRLLGPRNLDLGVTRIVRLGWQGQTWGFALADEQWRWRAVLPAAEWVPGDLRDLEDFARAIGLDLAEQEVAPLPRIGQEAAVPGAVAAHRWFGVPARGLVLLGVIATPAALLALGGPARSLWLAGIELALTYGAALVVWITSRLRLRRVPLS